MGDSVSVICRGCGNPKSRLEKQPSSNHSNLVKCTECRKTFIAERVNGKLSQRPVTVTTDQDGQIRVSDQNEVKDRAPEPKEGKNKEPDPRESR